MSRTSIATTTTTDSGDGVAARRPTGRPRLPWLLALGALVVVALFLLIGGLFFNGSGSSHTNPGDVPGVSTNGNQTGGGSGAPGGGGANVGNGGNGAAGANGGVTNSGTP